MKVSELTGAALDWAVAIAEGWKFVIGRMNCSREVWFERCDKTGTFRVLQHEMRPSTDWSQGGPIIERECITTIPYDAASSSPRNPEYWEAVLFERDGEITQYGPTPLIAAMRCFVASKLGDEVDVPEELL